MLRAPQPELDRKPQNALAATLSALSGTFAILPDVGSGIALTVGLQTAGVAEGLVAASSDNPEGDGSDNVNQETRSVQEAAL